MRLTDVRASIPDVLILKTGQELTLKNDDAIVITHVAMCVSDPAAVAHDAIVEIETGGELAARLSAAVLAYRWHRLITPTEPTFVADVQGAIARMARDLRDAETLNPDMAVGLGELVRGLGSATAAMASHTQPLSRSILVPPRMPIRVTLLDPTRPYVVHLYGVRRVLLG